VEEELNRLWQLNRELWRNSNVSNVKEGALNAQRKLEDLGDELDGALEAEEEALRSWSSTLPTC
jgi:hypothetical protein